jgi:hypothetical protein
MQNSPKKVKLGWIAYPKILLIETKHKKTAGYIPAENVPDGSIMLRYSSVIVTA